MLFVPIEAAFSAALQAEPNLFQEAFDRHIVIVSPTTLLATLRVIDSLWKQERQSQNAREIAERAGWLYDKFVLFIQDLDEVGNRLQQLDKAYSAARNKLYRWTRKSGQPHRAIKAARCSGQQKPARPTCWSGRCADSDDAPHTLPDERSAKCGGHPVYEVSVDLSNARNAAGFTGLAR